MMMHRKHLIKSLTVAYLLALVAVSLAPLGGFNISLEEIGVLHIRADYLLHAMAFVPFFWLWKFRWPGHHGWAVLLAGFVIAAASEGSHYWLPYRAYNVNDLVANLFGVLLGAALYPLLNRWFPRIIQ